MSSKLNHLLNQSINLDVVACYLKYGLLPPPGNKGFFTDEYISTYDFINLSRKNESDYNDILLVLKSICIQIVKQAKTEDRAIVLMLTSGLDSRLLYNVFFDLIKNEYDLDNFYNVTGDISGWDGRYSEAEKIKDNWEDLPINHKIIDVNLDDFESNVSRCNDMINRPINGLVSVVLERVYHYISKTWKNPLVISGLGDGIFFNTGGQQFLNKNADLNASMGLHVFSSDGTVASYGDYLTKRWSNVASKKLIKTKEIKVFPYLNLYERYIHHQQFFAKGPKVNWENYGYSNYYKLELKCPYQENKLLESLMNLPTGLLYDGRYKTVVLVLLEILEGKIPLKGISVTSPQRELLVSTYKDKVYGLIEISVLVGIGLVSKDLIRRELDSYIDSYSTLQAEGKFEKVNSYSIWKFVSMELWLRTIIGEN